MYSSNHDLPILIENALIQAMPAGSPGNCSPLHDAVHYAVFPGGKRFRPLLTMLAARTAGVSPDHALPAACAVEFLHTSSLIFDDLPAMDDAALRRGRPALHLVFGEDRAILAALALLNQAYALFGKRPALIAEAVSCIGLHGMIGGQALELETCQDPHEAVQFDSRNRKTSALLRLTLTAGAIAGGAHASDVAALARAGECLGEAYQICDDLLDQFMTCEDTGKPCRQDLRRNRPSHASAFGLEVCRLQVAERIDEAKACLLARFGKTPAVGAMLASIDKIVGEFGPAGLVAACSS